MLSISYSSSDQKDILIENKMIIKVQIKYMITCGRVLFLFTHLFIFGTFYIAQITVFNFYLLSHSYYVILQIFLLMMTMLSYYQASFSDPGYIKIKEIPKPVLSQLLSYTCSKCNDCWKPPRAHHCKLCKRCIFRMDHHCEWINNCVGAGNQKFFILFMFYCMAYCFEMIVICVQSIFYWKIHRREFKIMENALIIVNIILALFFLIFIGDMLFGQIKSIWNNQSQVEKAKKIVGKPGNLGENWGNIFGEDKLVWLIPYKSKSNMNYLELSYSLNYVRTNEVFFEDQLLVSEQRREFLRRYKFEQ